MIADTNTSCDHCGARRPCVEWLPRGSDDWTTDTCASCLRRALDLISPPVLVMEGEVDLWENAGQSRAEVGEEDVAHIITHRLKREAHGRAGIPGQYRLTLTRIDEEGT